MKTPIFLNDDRNKELSSKQVRIIFRFFFKWLGIKFNYNSTYDLGALFQVLKYAFCNNLSAEEASNQLKVLWPDAMVASADTLLRRLKSLDKKNVMKAFNRSIRKMTKSFGSNKPSCEVAIDGHGRSYYGDKNDTNILGSKRKNGTNWFHTYVTLEIVFGEKRFTLAVKKLSEDEKENIKIVKELIQIAKKYVKITCIYLDRGFYSTECINLLKKQRLYYVMPVTKNKGIKEVISKQRKFPATTTYTITNPNKSLNATFNLALVKEKRNEEKKNNPNEKPNKTFCFATNILLPKAEEVTNFDKAIKKFIEQLEQKYSRRWSIETGYRSKKKMTIKTTTKSNVVRLLYFLIECLLYNTWCELKETTNITIEMFKKLIEITINKKTLNCPIT